SPFAEYLAVIHTPAPIHRLLGFSSSRFLFRTSTPWPPCLASFTRCPGTTAAWAGHARRNFPRAAEDNDSEVRGMDSATQVAQAGRNVTGRGSVRQGAVGQDSVGQSSPDSTVGVGRHGEALAGEYLGNNGWTIVERNWH